MSDTAPMTEAAPSTDSPAGDVGGTTPTDAAPVEATPSELDREIPSGVQTFDREYVERLRGEAGNYRTKLREAEQLAAERAAALEQYSAFDGYSPEDMQVWTSMAASWKAGDYASVANTMQEIARNVLGDPASSAAERADAQAVLDDPQITAAAESLTPEQVRQIAREETEAQRVEREREEAVQEVFSKIRSAGYEDGSPEMNSVLWFATQRTEGDIEKAIEMHKAQEQAIIDRYVQSVANGGTPVRLPGSGAAAVETPAAPTNLAEARRAADAWLKERREQQ